MQSHEPTKALVQNGFTTLPKFVYHSLHVFFFATVVVARGRWCWLKATIIMSMISLNGHYDKPNAQADFIMQI
jgi:hypothetical protein